MSGSHGFRRLIVALGHAGADPAMLRAATEFAELLRLDLHWVFVEDEAVLTLAELPFAREIRLPTHEWTPLAAGRLVEELRHAAGEARRLVEQAIGRRDIPTRFEVLRGDPERCIAGLCSAGDVVVVSRPAGAVGPVGVVRLETAAHQMPAAVLLLPGGLRLRRGPVAAVLRDDRDPALEAAARLALAGGNALLLLPAAGREAAIERAAALGVPRSRITTRPLAGFDADAAIAALGGAHEHLIVIARGSGAGSAAGIAQLAAARAVPVLVTEPPGAAPASD